MKIKKLVSGIMSAVMLMSFIPVFPASTETGTTTYTYDGYSVDYSVTNEWNSGQSV